MEADMAAGTILVCDDDSAIRTVLKRIRPELPVVVMSAQNTILTAINAAERGAFDYLPKPFDLKELTTVVQRAMASPSAKPAAPEPRSDDRLPLIGRSPAMQEIYRVIARLTQTDLTVMIMGESGTGKELVARALHDYGKRRHGTFVAVNMAAIPKELVESELFGHERGAFTGATNRGVGRFEQADGGTLFLDEIGDMPLEAQTRLLRVLQQGEYTTVGGRTPIKTDVRIIAATNRDLRQLIQQGLFREDLYYRLNVVPMRLPPLRERAEDVPDLVRHFLHKAEDEGLPAKHLDVEALDMLKHYRWPGNVRELENLIRRLAVLHAGDEIPASAIAAELKEPPKLSDAVDGEEPISLGAAVERHLTKYFLDQGDKLPPPGLYDRILQEVERPLLSICLAATRGNQIRAAHLLGLNRNTLRKKIRDLGLEVIRGIRPD
jgi:two-component system nitrogen regulation response regulator GlnG